MAYQPIENYGVMGDPHSVALVSIDGSIDCMCFPSFVSPTIFATLKALLVLVYFMHARDTSQLVWLCIVAGLSWLLLAFPISGDVVSRGGWAEQGSSEIIMQAQSYIFDLVLVKLTVWRMTFKIL